jgi:hypothetical protein
VRRALCLFLGAVAGAAASASLDPLESLARAAFAEPVLSALILDRQVNEISGMALSRRNDALLWVVNDSDNGSALYALDPHGDVRRRVVVDGVDNLDWEDLDAFTLDGRHYLMVADAGDNGGVRHELSLIVIEEPDAALLAQDEPHVAPAWTIRMRWPDGPRDCEATAVDTARREVLLLSKKRVPAQLFRVPLDRPADSTQVRVAEEIARVEGIPQPTAAQLARDFDFWRWRGQVTGMDLDPAGRRLLVLTYMDGLLYERADGEPWRDALRRTPLRLGLPTLPQGEAIAFDRHGRSIWATTEKLPAPLIRLDPR